MQWCKTQFCKNCNYNPKPAAPLSPELLRGSPRDPRHCSSPAGKVGQPQTAAQGGNPEEGNIQTSHAPSTHRHALPRAVPGTASPGAGTHLSPSSTGYILLSHPMLVKTPSPKIQLQIKPSAGCRAIPCRSCAGRCERGSPCLGERGGNLHPLRPWPPARCEHSAVGDAGTASVHAPLTAAVLKAICKH